MRTPARARYSGYRFPAEIIGHAVWLYFRFPLGPRMVEELLAAHGISSATKPSDNARGRVGHLAPLIPKTHLALAAHIRSPGNCGELSFVELVVLMDVEVARVLALGHAGGDRTQRRAAEESHFDVVREAVDAEEPALALDSIKRRVPFDCLAHAGGPVRTMSASSRRPT